MAAESGRGAKLARGAVSTLPCNVMRQGIRMDLLPRPMKRFPLTKGLDPDKMVSYTLQTRPLSGILDKYLLLIRLAQETRSTTPVGAVSNRTDAHT